MSSGHELRYQIMRDARDILFEEMVLSPVPASVQTVAKANDLYTFVKLKE